VPYPPAETPAAAEPYRPRLPIPWAVLRDASGATVTLRGLAATHARALVGVSSTCGWCAPVVERIVALSGSTGPVALHAVVPEPDELERIPGALREAALVDAHRDLVTVFERPGTPWAVVLGADGLLAGGPVSGSGPVIELLDELAERFGA
ncbi:hypothetical protein CWC38_03740, partial [Kocuria tytonicola]